MGLIDIVTNLSDFQYYSSKGYQGGLGNFTAKKLPHGRDQKGGGSSRQPYFITPIPDGNVPNSPDFLLRNGYLNVRDSLKDSLRITKFLFGDVFSGRGNTSPIDGTLFIAKQQLLEFQSVKIPGGYKRFYNPLGTIAQAGVLSIGYHLNKQGVNPFNRGYLQGGDEAYYQNTFKDNFENGLNRLSTLYSSKISRTGGISDNASSLYGIDYDDTQNLLSYLGGPQSINTSAKTKIKIIGDGYGKPNDRTTNKQVKLDAEKIYSNFGNTSNNELLLNIKDAKIPLDPAKTKIFDPFTPPEPQRKVNNSTLLSGLNRSYNPNIDVFNIEKTYKTSYSASSDGQNLLDPLSLNTFGITLNSFLPGPDVQKNVDRVKEIRQTIEEYKKQDLVKFYFELIDNDYDINNTFLFFRAYINTLNDNFKAEWMPYKYVGRAESFYKYSGFSRDSSLSFTIYAHSREEMAPIYSKLNLLLGTTAPSYSGAGLMRGNFIKISIGDYLNDVPCIINNINIRPSFDAGWDLNRDATGSMYMETNIEYLGQLPRMIDVDMTFTPVHTFVPQNTSIYVG
tara:strand:+ start:158 stop:1846 length:1689 start_codon:yes stop_codon:yes gene_type:complete